MRWRRSKVVLSSLVLGLGGSLYACQAGSVSGESPVPVYDAAAEAAAPCNPYTFQAGPNDTMGTAPLNAIQHIVIIFLENHSFDNLFGSWPGAEGLASGTIPPQVGPDGKPYTILPQYAPYPAGVESLAGKMIPNGVFDLTKYSFQQGALVNDLLHRFYQEQYQINGGKMDSYVVYNDYSAGQSMGYWPTDTLPVPIWMKQHPAIVTLCDHDFHAAFGGSFLNHFWLIGAQSPVYENAPKSADAGVVTELTDGRLAAVLDTTSVPPSTVYNTSANDNEVTPDGFVVNTAYSVNEPHPPKYDLPGAAVSQLVPQQNFTTIADELDAAGVSWAWFAGGWNAALQGAGAGVYSAVGTCSGSAAVPASGPTFQYHHQPFTYFSNWGGTGVAGKSAPNGKWATARNLRDELDFVNELNEGVLPAVSWVKPLYDEHQNYTTVTDSEDHTVSLLNAIVASPLFSSTVVLITYDEHGGQFDHVPPPTTDKWGPGTRVPLIVVSPFAKGGVDSTVYDTTALLTFIEKRYGLAPLTTRDAMQADLSANALSFPSSAPDAGGTRADAGDAGH
jgi:phospholipase C